MDLNNEKFYTINEVVTILKLKHNQVYKLIKDKKLQAYRIGATGKRNKYNRKPWRVREIDLAEFIKQGASYKNDS